MKRVLSVLLSVLMVLSVFTALPMSAYAAESGDYEYWVLDDGAVEITKYIGSGGDIVIPSVLEGKPVTSIGNEAFEYCYDITSVTIPDSVTTIYDYAFYDCSGLTSVTFGKSVEYIGYYAFRYCVSLTSVTIPESVTYIDDRAFGDCGNLKSATLTQYAVDRFRDCFPAYTIESIVLTDSVTTIGYEAFRFCSSLTSIDIPASVTSIGDYAFSDCDCLTSIDIPDSVTSIGDYAFYDSDKLTSIDIPASVTSIGNSAFSDCVSLTTVTIPDSVTTIGDYAFYCCDDLKNVTLSQIALDRFHDCFSTGSIERVVLSDSVTNIGAYAFHECSSLISIDIPASVTTIGDHAFHDCGSLTSIDIPASVTTIGDYAFSGCNSLTCVDIPDSVTSIGDDAFFYCENLTSVTIGDSVTSIGNDAFSGCKSLTSVTLGKSVESIGDHAFMDCSGLASLTIPDSVTAIGDHAFEGCSGLTSLTIGGSVKTIGDFAFEGCTGLTSVVIPGSVTSIGYEAFYDCSSLTSVIIPDTVTSIDEYAFSRNNGMFIYCHAGTAAERFAKNRYFPYIIYPDDLTSTNVFYVDTTAISGSLAGTSSISCSLKDDHYTGVRIGKDLWAFDLDDTYGNKEEYSSDSSPSNSYYSITEVSDIMTISFGSKESYIDDEYYYTNRVTYPCYYDDTCRGDTLVVENSTVRLFSRSYEGKNTDYYRVYWKNHDKAKYGMAKCYNSDYELVGEAEPSYRRKISLLKTYVYDILPLIRNTVIDTDQMLIDWAAEDLGLKKDDLRQVFSANQSYWNADDSELPDGYSYQKGAYYLRAVGEAKPAGYEIFVLDAPTGYYAIRSERLASESSGSDYTFVPNTKYEVVRCNSEDSFTVVSKGPVAADGVYIWFFRPGEDYCFGYNSIGEIDNGSSSGHSISWGGTVSSEYPLRAPVISSMTNTFDGVTAKWDAVSGAERYRVFVKGDTDWIAVGDTADTTFTYTGCKSGDLCTMMVRCVSADGKTYLSRLIHNERNIHYVAAPVVTGTQGLVEGNKITWKPVDGNAKYRVFVKSGKSWKALGDTFDTSFIHSSQGSTSIFVQPGTDYTYTVACISFNGAAVTSGYNTTGWTQYYNAELLDPKKQDDPDEVIDQDMKDAVSGVEMEFKSTASGLAMSARPASDEEIGRYAALVGNVLTALDITLIKNGAEYRPDGSVKVSIPCDDPEAKVFRAEADGTVTDMKAVYKDGYLTFTTDHFSLYLVAAEKKYILGDADGDGEVTILDATTIQRHLASLPTDSFNTDALTQTRTAR